MSDITSTALHPRGEEDSEPAPSAPPVRRRRKRIGRARIIAAAVVVTIYGAAAVLGPILLNFDPTRTRTADRLQAPGSTLADGSLALLGTDQIGQDILAQIMYGARISLTVGVATLVLAGVLGVLVGLLAGFYGGWVDSALMRLADIQLAFPSILLAIFIASVLGPSIINLVFVLAISNWVIFARVTRGQVLALRDREYVEASRTLGAKKLHLIFKTILPGCVAPIMVVATVELGNVILAEAALSFLGLGVPVNIPSWGTTISNGRDFLADAWWISTFPGIALAILVLTFGLLGDSLRDRYDPRIRSM